MSKSYTLLRRPEQIAAITYEGESTFGAVASDGTMWARIYGKDTVSGQYGWHWQQIPPLPPIATGEAPEDVTPLRRIA